MIPEPDRNTDDPTVRDREASLRLLVVMSRALRSVTSPLRQRLKHRDLSPTEFAVLEVLFHRGPLPLSVLADRILITGASTTYTVKRLEERGLVRRRPSQEDQRVVFGELTSEGEELIAEVFPEHAEGLRVAMGGLSLQEKIEAANLLKRLGLAAEGAGTGRGGAEPGR